MFFPRRQAKVKVPPSMCKVPLLCEGNQFWFWFFFLKKKTKYMKDTASKHEQSAFHSTVKCLLKKLVYGPGDCEDHVWVFIPKKEITVFKKHIFSSDLTIFEQLSRGIQC